MVFPVDRQVAGATHPLARIGEPASLPTHYDSENHNDHHRPPANRPRSWQRADRTAVSLDPEDEDRTTGRPLPCAGPDRLSNAYDHRRWPALSGKAYPAFGILPPPLGTMWWLG